MTLDAPRRQDDPDTARAPEAGAAVGDVAAVWRGIPKTDAIRPSRFPGLTGWRAWHWVALVFASALYFWALGGRWGVSLAWTPFVTLGAGLGGFIAASYLPRGGVRAEASVCSLPPLAMTILVPTLASPDQPLTAALGVAALAAFALQRARGVGCAT